MGMVGAIKMVEINGKTESKNISSILDSKEETIGLIVAPKPLKLLPEKLEPNRGLKYKRKLPILLKTALEDHHRIEHGLAVVFATKNKHPNFKRWQDHAKGSQTEKDIEKLYGKRTDFTAYSYYTGVGGIIDIDFDWSWLYYEAENYFGDRFQTRTLRTPNGGYRVLLITNTPNDYLEYKNEPPHIEIHGKSTHQVVVHGRTLTEQRKMASYELVKDLPIRRDPTIIQDFKKFIVEVMGKCFFLNYPCIKSKLKGKKNELTQEQRTNIGAFFIAENIDMGLAINFFQCTDDFDYDTTRKHLERLRRKNFKHPRCHTLRKNFDWDVKDCAGCPRSSHHNNSTIQSENKVEVLPSIEDFLNQSREQIPKLRHGQGYDPELGLTYIGLPFQGTATGYYGISLKKPIRAVHESDGIKDNHANSIRLIGGFTDPLTSKTCGQIQNLLEEQHHTGEIKFNSLSEVFLKLLSSSYAYLDLNEGDRQVLILWIIGTYLRALFTWYPYLCFEGLRDVGKSTALEFLSHTCYNGGGDVSGGYTEADLHKSASSSMGFFAIDHLEERLKSPEKRQIMDEFLENAWKLNAYVSKRDQNTGEHLKLHLACSVALGTRRTTETIAEKGIIFRMEETSDTGIRKNSLTMHKDPSFIDLEGELMATALHYQDRVLEAYESIPVKPGLGREYNKFAPFLALARVIDEESEGASFYDMVLDYADNYRVNRKSEREDTEEILLRIIIRDKLSEVTNNDLADRMRGEGYENYSWQRARSDIGKLGVVKHYNKRTSPITLNIDLERARKRAEQRGIKIVELDNGFQDCKIFMSENFPSTRDLNDLQRLIFQEVTKFGKHTISSVIDEISSNMPYGKAEILEEIQDMISKNWIQKEDD